MQPPDDSPCWEGAWSRVDPLVDLWAQGALARTVAALPTLHPWRLGDDKASVRSVLWSAVPEGATTHDVELVDGGVAILTQSAPPPSLPLGDVSPADSLLADAEMALATLATIDRRQPHDQALRTFLPSDPGVRRWVGGMALLPGAWLPDLAILPRSQRDIDDPGTRWDTESVAFAARHSVHAGDMRFASDVLAPHVTALILDHVPDDAAVTMAGNAVHIWWEYTDQSRLATGRAGRTLEVATRVRDAVPSFVLADYPDHSDRVEDRLAERAAQADAYRAGRVAGRNQDPTLQRIYSQAQATYQLGQRKD